MPQQEKEVLDTASPGTNPARLFSVSDQERNYGPRSQCQQGVPQYSCEVCNLRDLDPGLGSF